MADTESWQVTTSAAEVYERQFVPALFGQWAVRLCEFSHVSPGERVLDVACGTGVVAREALRRGARVTGLDVNEGMLAVARQVTPDAHFEQGDVASLPFPDGSFDKTLCQFALMYFSDRATALREMARITGPDGTLGLAVWAGIDQSPGYQVLAEIAEKATTQEAADLLRSPFVLGEANTLVAVLEEAGLGPSRIDTQVGSVRFDSIETFVDAEVKGSPLEERLGQLGYTALMEKARKALQPFSGPTGLEFPIAAHLVTCAWS